MSRIKNAFNRFAARFTSTYSMGYSAGNRHAVLTGKKGLVGGSCSYELFENGQSIATSVFRTVIGREPVNIEKLQKDLHVFCVTGRRPGEM